MTKGGDAHTDHCKQYARKPRHLFTLFHMPTAPQHFTLRTVRLFVLPLPLIRTSGSLRWYRAQHYVSRQPPTHIEVQQTLVDLGDKQGSFAGSKEWIGSSHVH